MGWGTGSVGTCAFWVLGIHAAHRGSPVQALEGQGGSCMHVGALLGTSSLALFSLLQSLGIHGTAQAPTTRFGTIFPEDRGLAQGQVVGWDQCGVGEGAEFPGVWFRVRVAFSGNVDTVHRGVSRRATRQAGGEGRPQPGAQLGSGMHRTPGRVAGTDPGGQEPLSFALRLGLTRK